MQPKELPHAWKQEPDIYELFKVTRPFEMPDEKTADP